MSKWKMIIWFICLVVTYGCFFMMNIGTASPEASHGNGNPWLLLLMILWPFFMVFYYFTIELVTRWLLATRSKRIVLSFLTLCVIGFVGVFFPIKSKAQAVRNALLGSNNEEYHIGWNQFTNSIYFNTFTFLLSVLLCGLVAAFLTMCILLVQNRREEE
ncbi:hypothetical protein [Pontibacillus sp. HMF3514]|uniref:hypothetical protein n=1 Tax=Pontibacillus sp. HMF3514 TaxID=2692425 RepID=UPI0013203287|nr:hypothetical protein [Pontibacillus sp. HMF3514]QHE50751.1 hypothetical protein GS400_01175 [Pontibacillus sp. HMF3514]